MPLKNGNLTPREREFAAVYARTGDTAYAAQKAGFRSMSGGTNALARTGVKEEVERLFREELQGEILPLALKRHRQILTDERSQGPTLTKAIDTAYKYALAPREDDPGAKDLHELSIDALRAKLGHLLIEGEAVETPVDVAALDPLFG